MKFLLSFILVALTTSICYATANVPLRFDNFQVYRVIPKTIEQIAILKELEDNPQGYMFWSDVRHLGQPVHIMVPPHLKYNFEDFLKLRKLDGHVWIENVQNSIDNERSQVVTRNGGFDWTDYHTLEVVNF